MQKRTNDFQSNVKKIHPTFEVACSGFFNKTNIVFKFSKSYIGYLSLIFFKQKVGNFKTKKFPVKLENLEIYIGKTNYFRNYIPYYAQLIEQL